MRIIKWLLIFFAHRRAKQQEKILHSGIYCIDGQLVYCQLCKQIIRYPPTRIPLTKPQPGKDTVFSPDGFPINSVVDYGRFHLSCAMKMLCLIDAKDLEYVPNTEKKQ